MPSKKKPKAKTTSVKPGPAPVATLPLLDPRQEMVALAWLDLPETIQAFWPSYPDSTNFSFVAKDQMLPAGLDKLWLLLSPVVAIQVCGTSAEIEKRLETVRAAATINRDVFLLDETKRQAIGRSINDLENYLSHLLARIRDAESKLAAAGLRFDSRTRTLKSGKTKLSFLNVAIVKAWDCLKEITPPAEPQRQDKKKTTQDKPNRRKKKAPTPNETVRQDIKELLTPWFGADALDAGPRGNIQNAIDNAKRPSGDWVLLGTGWEKIRP